EALIGFDNRADTISGGGGSDAMAGGLGDDTYRFGIGDGSDSIQDTGGIDQIRFGAKITQDMLTFRDVDGDLVIELTATGDRLVVLGGYKAAPIESFVFEDRTTLTIADVRSLILAGRNNGSQDVIDIRELVTNSDVTGGAGHDRLLAANDSTIVFNPGDGIDRVEMPGGVTRATVEIAAYGSTQLVVRLAALDSTDLVLDFVGTGDQLVIAGALGSGAVPTLRFADGTVWDAAALVQRFVADQAGDGADIVLGSARADVIAGGVGFDDLRGAGGDDSYRFAAGDGQDMIDDSAGVDTLNITGYRPDEMRVVRSGIGRGDLLLVLGDGADSVLLRYGSNFNGVERVSFSDGTVFTREALFARLAGEGTDGDDRLAGTTAAEVFNGGAGNDVLTGGGGDDVFRFKRGDGQDRIEPGALVDGKAVLEFGAGIALEDVIARRDRDGNLVLAIRDTNDRVTLVEPGGDEDPVVGLVRFADGRSLSFAQLALTVLETDRDDHIVAASGITNTGGGSGADIYGGLGNDWLEGGRGADILTGGKGNDRLEGHAGADIYYFARGDGQDVV
ncbi:MAG TPA: calcium-binding protein, partial [Sphingomonas sp.]|nr:calcium-binding protein [Sphingomonas sp.]